MSDEHTVGGAALGSDPEAGVRKHWWPGWIWAIPIAALLVVGWLGIRALVHRGEGITINFADAHDIKKGNTTIMYRGTVVGEVSGVELNDAGDAVTVKASIDERAKKFLRAGTRFWLRGATPNMGDLSSLRSVVSGPTIVMEPGPGPERTNFTGLAYQPIRPVADTQALLYQVMLSGNAGSLKQGDPVELNGFTVGEIRDVGFSYDPATGTLMMPATVALYPGLLHIRGTATSPTPVAARGAISGLIHEGLRARLEREPPLVGSYRITLTMMPDTSRPTVVATTGLPLIPTAPGGDLSSIVSRVNHVPIDRIAQNVLAITRHVETLVSSPDLDTSVAQLAATLKQIHATTAQIGPQVASLVTRLQQTADELDRTARSANQVVGGTATQTGVAPAITEMTEAARAVRSLAEYLDRHPEALVRGRTE